MFKGQPKGLFALALANTGERFGYYTMLAIFTLYMQAKFGWDENTAGHIYAIFLAGVYFTPLLGGFLADKIGYGKCVTTGIFVMFAGYLALAIPMVSADIDKITMFLGLVCIAVGTGLFKGNLQVMVGNLYDDPKYESKRDAAFSLFYMAINLGSMFAPAMAKALFVPYIEGKGYHFVPVANAISEYGASAPEYLQALAAGYRLCFYVACASLVLSILIYFLCRPWYKHADVNVKQAKAAAAPVQELTPKQTKDRIVALLLVFAVVIFFWMAFHQNGSALTFFADKYTNLNGITGPARIWFKIWSLFLIAVSVYTLFAIFQSDTRKSRIISGIATIALWIGAFAIYQTCPETMNVTSSDFQQFNPFFVVALTPLSVAAFSGLAKKGKEPSAPLKIGIGMLVAGVGFCVITVASQGLISPMDLEEGQTQSILSPNWLIGTYFTLTIAELLLSPMGISFVSKVAPPKYKGLMMGGWFAATAIGNYLSRIPSALWNKISLMSNWSILIALCFIAGFIMLILRRRLEEVTKA